MKYNGFWAGETNYFQRLKAKSEGKKKKPLQAIYNIFWASFPLKTIFEVV